MSTLISFTDIHEYLADHAYSLPKSEAYALDRITACLAALGNPHDAYRIVHVAGTSGKTSTCYYIASLLQSLGYAVGLTVSPHVDEINERAQINRMPLTETVYCAKFSQFSELIERTSIRLTYFELTIAFAFWLFADQNVDYAVVEVGLGGLLDSTNVTRRSDKLCVIADIGFDHTDILGNTLESIAFQKAGIIKPENHVFMNRQSDVVHDVVAAIAKTKSAELHIVHKDFNSPTLPSFQKRNFALALSVAQHIQAQNSLAPLSAQQLADATEVRIPARMEIIQYDNDSIVLDGSHNTQKIRALVDAIRCQFPDDAAAVMLALAQNKSPGLGDIVRELRALGDSIIVTTFSSQRAGSRNAVDAAHLASLCEDAGFEKIKVLSDPLKAFEYLRAQPERVKVVTGSYFLLNHIRPACLAL